MESKHKIKIVCWSASVRLFGSKLQRSVAEKTD